MPSAVSLFTGCGGSDAGIIHAGFDVVMANDILTYARDVYRANLPETDYVVNDVRKVQTFPAAQLLVGCYPCQGFSQGGARQADRRINYLYREFARALQAIQPRAFIVENVSGLRRSTYEHLLNEQLTLFRAAGDYGYNVVWKELCAHNYGVAQERKRLVIVGIRNDFNITYEFPLPTHDDDSGYVTIAQALDGLPEWPDGEFCDDEFHWYYLSRNRRRDWQDVSKTIVSHMRHMPLHPISPMLRRIDTDHWEFATADRARRFSYREAAKLQGFYDDFTTHGGDLIFPEEHITDPKKGKASLRDKYTVVGNAVPPPLFAAVAGALPDIFE
jgi:DNA (cytosine-5)-methyltransferase 1